MRWRGSGPNSLRRLRKFAPDPAYAQVLFKTSRQPRPLVAALQRREMTMLRVSRECFRQHLPVHRAGCYTIADHPNRLAGY